VLTQVIVYVLTALAAVVVVLTRVRLVGEDAAAGRFQVGRALLDAHTVVGVLALVTWTAFLVAPDGSALGGSVTGIVALAFWWVVVALGVLILVRWMPAGGKHASPPAGDTWSDGPGLSVLAHVGMVVGVLVFTWDYLFSVV
jgi:hypothetical protein